MKAIVFKAINQLPVLEEVNLDLREDELLVPVQCASLNHRDLFITKGLYPGLVPNTIMGADGAGEYNGKRVVFYPASNWGNNEAFQGPNFKVLGVPEHGTFAQFKCIHKDYLFNAPQHLNDEEVAALPVVGLTAYRALFKRAFIKKEDTILVTGIGGGVALIAAQMAKTIGCKVLFTSGDDDKISKAMALGFDHGFNYKNENHVAEIKEVANGIDVIIDGNAGESFYKYLNVCNYGAKIVFYGGGQGKMQNVSPQPIFWKQLSILGSTMGSLSDFKDMLDFVDHHKIKPVVDSVFDWQNFSSAFKRLDETKQFGKIILKIT